MTIYQKSSVQTQEAVIFFVNGEIAREMLYAEFEALLDCVVPIRDLAGITLEAAYVHVDAQLAPQAVVLFLIPFDSDGFPDLQWDVPLRLLADRATARGPDLGFGPVRLATRSECPMPDQAEKLWDMHLDAAGNTLELIRERLGMNRLGLVVADAAPTVAATPPPAAPMFMPMMAGALGQGGSDALLMLMQQSNQQLESMREQTQRETQALQRELAASREQVRALRAEKQGLVQRLAEERGVFEREKAGLREELSQQSGRARAVILEARRALERERDTVLAERDAHMRTELGRIEQERALQEEQLLSLRSELTELRRDKLRLMGEGADKFFASLKEKGVKFVAFQPGIGHVTIPMDELQRYLGDTENYVAEKCGVSEEHYRRWLAHYNEPACQGTAGNGGLCAKPLQKILKPAEFLIGLHDRCEIHKQFATR